MTEQIIGMKKIVTKDRIGSFGMYEKEEDFKDQKIIFNAIQNKEDNRYFDKYGNEYTIDEIELKTLINRRKKIKELITKIK
jgi:5'(3')-deoxyribonucleotidase